ncbi:hypothetical protein [Bacillus phage CP-51]|uniref:Uncharacterized protein n=1 Tax=Bacillus phage CP-51 TaxID=1391188 RepID=A0A068EU10_9CAUD|nr:hypothetical protein OZ73_gp006 [Bacillus phage CP-51]AID50441.1 hypothetical protein [Bacillus phage CP-51]
MAELWGRYYVSSHIVASICYRHGTTSPYLCPDNSTFDISLSTV